MAKFLHEQRNLRILRKQPRTVHPASPRPQRRDCQGQLITALQSLAGKGATIDQATMRPWCSATFLGAQHRIRMRIDGPDAMERANWLADALGEHAFRLHGHIVADASVDERRMDGEHGALVSLAVLTIEDW
jgi:hypothetical protein